MKIGILGAGISGLSMARLLDKRHKVEILECASEIGGIARTRNVNGIAYHVTGGHCFNSKYQEVLDFVFNEILPKENWHIVTRRANIRLRGFEINYPIEYSVKQLYEFDNQLAIDISRDFLAANDDHSYKNLEDWFRKKFGNTLAEVYFIPYNKKIWNRPVNEMSPAWVEGKLPIPDKASFFKGLISDETDKMPHASFYYPNSNNQNTFIDNLAKGLNIQTNYDVEKISKVKNKWLINDHKEYDILISTLPLNILPSLISGADNEILEQAKKLKYNKVTTMLWETKGTTQTWTYVPDADSLFHRYIHIGNFFTPAKNYTITEVIGEVSYAEMEKNGKKDPFLLRAVDYHVSDYAYVVFDENYQFVTKEIKRYLDEIGIYTLGRFGEWEYYNMDVCIKRSMELTTAIERSLH